MLIGNIHLKHCRFDTSFEMENTKFGSYVKYPIIALNDTGEIFKREFKRRLICLNKAYILQNNQIARTITKRPENAILVPHSG